MRDQQDTHAGLVAQAQEFVRHLLLRRHVQRGRHLIAEKELGSQQHEQRDGNTLAHASADFVGTAVENASVRWKAQRLEHMERLVLVEFPTVALQRFFELGAEGPERIEGRRGVLGDEPDFRSKQRSPLFVAQGEQIGPGKAHASAGHFCRVGGQPQKGFQDRRFSGTGLAGDDMDLARRKFQRIVVQRLKRAVRDAEIVQLQQRFRSRHSGSNGADRFDTFYCHHFASLISE